MSWASLSLKNLTNALRAVSDWQDLGIQLDIQYHELQMFVREHQTTEERKRAMLQFWLDDDTNASWKKVISALSEMQLNRVAEEIKRKYQLPPRTWSEDVPPPTVTAELESVPTADPPSIPLNDQPGATLTAQSENVTAVDPALPTDQTEGSSTEGVTKVQLEIATLETMYDDLVRKAGVFFSKRQALSSDFFVEFRISVAVLPTSLKYQHSYFLKHHSSQIAKATTVEEIFSILNSYWNFLNCNLLAHIIGKFGDEELQRQLSRYITALQSFRTRTKITDFVQTCTSHSKHLPECVGLKAKMGSEWEPCTLEDAEKYRQYMAHISSLADYVLYLERGAPGSIYLLWRVPNHAIDFLAAAMNSKFLQCHCIEEVVIDDVNLKEYKRQHHIYPDRQFDVILRHVDELSEGLVWASQGGCLEYVIFLLSTGVEVNSRGQSRGRTALMWASEGGYLDVVKELLRAQAGVDMEDEFGRTALTVASVRGHTDVVQLLLSSGAQVDLQDTVWGRTALMQASDSGHTDIVQFLLSSGAQVDLQDERGWTALMLAGGSGHTDVVQLLLSSGAQVDLQDESGRTALMWASGSGHTDVVQLLLTSGAQVDLQDTVRGWTALMLAGGNGHTDVVQLLLSSGTQVDLQDEGGRTVLTMASVRGHTDVVQLLLSSRAQVDLQDTVFGRTALMSASLRGHTDVVQLLSSGAQVDLQDKNGWSALMLAGGSGHTDVLQLLLSSGAQVDLQDERGWTALMLAGGSGHTDAVQLLLSSGAQVDLQDEDGLTALIYAVKPRSYLLRHDETGTVKDYWLLGLMSTSGRRLHAGRSAVFYGAEKGDLEMVKLLIQGGANLSIKDKDGVTADQVAEVQGHHAVCEELRKHMHGGHRPLSKTAGDRVLATGQLLRALYKRLEERILKTQKREWSRTQGFYPEIILPSTPRRKGVRNPRVLRQQEENSPEHVH